MNLGNLEQLTESERELIYDVIKRNEELEQKDHERILRLKNEVKAIKLRGTIKAGIDADNTCARCRKPFGWSLFKNHDLCYKCKHKICDNCQVKQKGGAKWMCVLCNKQAELDAMSGLWFHKQFRKSKRNRKTNKVITGTDLVKTSMKKPPHSRTANGTANSVQADVQRAFTNNNTSPKSDGDGSGQRSSGPHSPMHSLQDAVPKDTEKRMLSELIGIRPKMNGQAPGSEQRNISVQKVSSKRYDSDSSSGSEPNSPQTSHKDYFDRSDSVRSSVASSVGRITQVTDNASAISDISTAPPSMLGSPRLSNKYQPPPDPRGSPTIRDIHGTPLNVNPALSPSRQNQNNSKSAQLHTSATYVISTNRDDSSSYDDSDIDQRFPNQNNSMNNESSIKSGGGRSPSPGPSLTSIKSDTHRRDAKGQQKSGAQPPEGKQGNSGPVPQAGPYTIEIKADPSEGGGHSPSISNTAACMHEQPPSPTPSNSNTTNTNAQQSTHYLNMFRQKVEDFLSKQNSGKGKWPNVNVSSQNNNAMGNGAQMPHVTWKRVSLARSDGYTSDSEHSSFEDIEVENIEDPISSYGDTKRSPSPKEHVVNAEEALPVNETLSVQMKLTEISTSNNSQDSTKQSVNQDKEWVQELPPKAIDIGSVIMRHKVNEAKNEKITTDDDTKKEAEPKVKLETNLDDFVNDKPLIDLEPNEIKAASKARTVLEHKDTISQMAIDVENGDNDDEMDWDDMFERNRDILPSKDKNVYDPGTTDSFDEDVHVEIDQDAIDNTRHSASKYARMIPLKPDDMSDDLSMISERTEPLDEQQAVKQNQVQEPSVVLRLPNDDMAETRTSITREWVRNSDPTLERIDVPTLMVTAPSTEDLRTDETLETENTTRSTDNTPRSSSSSAEFEVMALQLSKVESATNVSIVEPPEPKQEVTIAGDFKVETTLTKHDPPTNIENKDDTAEVPHETPEDKDLLAEAKEEAEEREITETVKEDIVESNDRTKLISESHDATLILESDINDAKQDQNNEQGKNKTKPHELTKQNTLDILALEAQLGYQDDSMEIDDMFAQNNDILSEGISQTEYQNITLAPTEPQLINIELTDDNVSKITNQANDSSKPVSIIDWNNSEISKSVLQPLVVTKVETTPDYSQSQTATADAIVETETTSRSSRSSDGFDIMALQLSKVESPTKVTENERTKDAILDDKLMKKEYVETKDNPNQTTVIMRKKTIVKSEDTKPDLNLEERQAKAKSLPGAVPLPIAPTRSKRKSKTLSEHTTSPRSSIDIRTLSLRPNSPEGDIAIDTSSQPSVSDLQKMFNAQSTYKAPRVSAMYSASSGNSSGRDSPSTSDDDIVISAEPRKQKQSKETKTDSLTRNEEIKTYNEGILVTAQKEVNATAQEFNDNIETSKSAGNIEQVVTPDAGLEFLPSIRSSGDMLDKSSIGTFPLHKTREVEHLDDLSEFNDGFYSRSASIASSLDKVKREGAESDSELSSAAVSQRHSVPVTPIPDERDEYLNTQTDDSLEEYKHTEDLFSEVEQEADDVIEQSHINIVNTGNDILVSDKHGTENPNDFYDDTIAPKQFETHSDDVRDYDDSVNVRHLNDEAYYDDVPRGAQSDRNYVEEYYDDSVSDRYLDNQDELYDDTVNTESYDTEDYYDDTVNTHAAYNQRDTRNGDQEEEFDDNTLHVRGDRYVEEYYDDTVMNQRGEQNDNPIYEEPCALQIKEQISDNHFDDDNIYAEVGNIQNDKQFIVPSPREFDDDPIYKESDNAPLNVDPNSSAGTAVVGAGEDLYLELIGSNDHDIGELDINLDLDPNALVPAKGESPALCMHENPTNCACVHKSLCSESLLSSDSRTDEHSSNKCATNDCSFSSSQHSLDVTASRSSVSESEEERDEWDSQGDTLAYDSRGWESGTSIDRDTETSREWDTEVETSREWDSETPVKALSPGVSMDALIDEASDTNDERLNPEKLEEDFTLSLDLGPRSERIQKFQNYHDLDFDISKYKIRNKTNVSDTEFKHAHDQSVNQECICGSDSLNSNNANLIEPKGHSVNETFSSANSKHAHASPRKTPDKHASRQRTQDIPPEKHSSRQRAQENTSENVMSRQRTHDSVPEKYMHRQRTQDSTPDKNMSRQRTLDSTPDKYMSRPRSQERIHEQFRSRQRTHENTFENQRSRQRPHESTPEKQVSRKKTSDNLGSSRKVPESKTSPRHRSSPHSSYRGSPSRSPRSEPEAPELGLKRNASDVSNGSARSGGRTGQDKSPRGSKRSSRASGDRSPRSGDRSPRSGDPSPRANDQSSMGVPLSGSDRDSLQSGNQGMSEDRLKIMGGVAIVSSSSGDQDSVNKRESVQSTSSSVPSIAVTPSMVEPEDEKSPHQSDQEENIDEIFAAHGAPVPTKTPHVSMSPMNSPQNSNLVSPFNQSVESMSSVYSGAEDGNFGKIPVTGEILFGLDYNYKQSTFEIKIQKCKDLAPVDTKKKRSDPYVKTYLLPDKSKGGKRKTRVKKHTLNPVYDEVIRYPISKKELMTRTLWVAVWNHDTLGRNDFLGEVTLHLDILDHFDNEPHWYTLEDRNQTTVTQMTYKGDFEISLKYVTSENVSSTRKVKGKSSSANRGGELHVQLTKARNLTAVRSNGTSDPFVKGYLLPEKSSKLKKKSPVIKKTCSPEFNHTFVFEDVTYDDLQERSLELTIWDHDRFTSHVFLGGVRLNNGTGKSYGKDVDWMDAHGDEVNLWNMMMSQVNYFVQGNVMLRPSMGKR